MWQTFLISLLVVALAFALLAIRILLTRRGSFPKTHVSQNAAMRKNGIHCAQSQDFEERHRKGLYD